MMGGRAQHCVAMTWLMDKVRRVRRRAPLTLFLLCMLTVVLVFYRAMLWESDGPHISGGMPVFSQSGKLSRPAGEPKPIARKRSNKEAYSLLTQDPRHVEKQKQVKAHLLANINKMVEARDDSSGKKVGLYDGIKHLQITEGHKIPSGRRDVLSAGTGAYSFPVFIHLDMKGAAPKVSYLEKIFPVFRSFGVGGILLEYEDTFPYSGLLEGVSARDAYSVPDILRIQQLAAQNQLELVPLIQTFGHLEFVLKLEKFKHLREVPMYPLAICPSHNETLPLIKDMVDQIMELHPDIRYLHIGSDEVYHLGRCSRCSDRMQHDHTFDPLGNLFLSHVAAVAKYARHKHVIPLMWDDHLRTLPEDILRDSQLAEYVQIMVWKYDAEVLSAITPSTWDKYGRIFDGVWIASAFKGADGPDALVPHTLNRLTNHRVWRKAIDIQSQKMHIHGVVMTGWQRYDHFALLCELLPVGLLSMAVSISQLVSGRHDRFVHTLNCEPYENLLAPPSVLVLPIVCSYPGSDVYMGAQKLLQLDQQFTEMTRQSGVKGWMSQWQGKKRYSSTYQVQAASEGIDLIIMSIGKLRVEMQESLSEIYNPSTVTEWMETHFAPVHTRILEFWDRRQRLLNRTVWERRPINVDVASIP